MCIYIYYHNDLDGRCSAAIVAKTYLDNKVNDEIVLKEINYNMRPDLDSIEEKDNVWILDFSFSLEDMKKLEEKTKNVVWIDHHATAIEKLKEINASGVRDTSMAACMLTWKYCFRGKAAPSAVKYIADFDAWKFKYGDETWGFKYGAEAMPNHIIMSGTTLASFWLKCFENDSGFVHDVKGNGKAIQSYVNNYNAEYLQKYGYEAEVYGSPYKCYAMNMGRSGSMGFGDYMKSHDICISYAFNGSEYEVSFYTENEDIDVGKIAVQFGGGGHKGAAGFIWKDAILPFGIAKVTVVAKPDIKEIKKAEAEPTIKDKVVVESKSIEEAEDVVFADSSKKDPQEDA